MTILNLIKKSAIMLNIKEILEEDLDSITYDTQESVLSNNFTLKRMFEFAKLVINEVTAYTSNLKQINLSSTSCKIELKDIPNFLKIVEVKNQFGTIKYEIINKALNFEKDDLYTIIYQAIPETKYLSQEIDLSSGVVCEDIFVNGLNSYYCLAMGMFAEYNVYNAQYNERLSKIKNLKLFSMPCRSWNG